MKGCGWSGLGIEARNYALSLDFNAIIHWAAWAAGSRTLLIVHPAASCWHACVMAAGAQAGAQHAEARRRPPPAVRRPLPAATLAAHLFMHCRWKAWVQMPHTTGLSSPGYLPSGGQPSKGMRQMPQTSSPAGGYAAGGIASCTWAAKGGHVAVFAQPVSRQSGAASGTRGRSAQGAATAAHPRSMSSWRRRATS